VSMKVIPSKTNSLILVRSIIVLTVLIATATLLWSLQPAHAAGTLTVNSLAETNDATYDAAECALPEASNTANNNPADKTQTAPSLFQTPQARQVEKQYPPEELEQLRSKLLELVDTVKEYSDLLLPDNPEFAGKLDAARKQFEQYSPQQLNTLRAALNPAEMNARFGEARAALEQYRPALESIRQEKRQRSKLQQPGGMLQIESAGLPDREGPDPVCDALVGSGRISFALNTAADAIFIAAAGVRAVASRGCNQVLVALGEGGNTSSLCIIVDGVYYVAVAVRAKLTGCDSDYTGRTVDANFSRLGHIHTDLENSVANDNTNKTAIINNDNANTTTITGNDNSNKTAIVTNDNTNTTNIIANSNANKGDVIINANSNTTTITTAISNAQTTIVNNDNANKNTIVANDNANATMLRDLILRTQIEADLASTDGSAFVALYLTPGAKGGYLELVRSIVVQTIANIGGANTAQANALVAKGDAYKTAGDYRSAYASYRQAYKKAQGL